MICLSEDERKGLLAQSKSRFLWMKIIEAVTFPGAPCKYCAYTFNRSLVSPVNHGSQISGITDQELEKKTDNEKR